MLIFCLIGAALVAIIVYHTTEKMYLDDTDVVYPTISNDVAADGNTIVSECGDTGIAISLIRSNGHVVEPTPPYSIFVMIWNDGHILLMEPPKDSTGSQETLGFLWGIVAQGNLKELKNRLVSLFRLRDGHIQVLDIGPSASSIILTINTGATFVTINTWQQYESAKHFPDKLMLQAENTIDNRDMYLEEFYERWKSAIEDILVFKEEIARNKLLPVDVVVDHGIVRIYGEEGALLLEQKLFQE